MSSPRERAVEKALEAMAKGTSYDPLYDAIVDGYELAFEATDLLARVDTLDCVHCRFADVPPQRDYEHSAGCPVGAVLAKVKA